MLVCFWSFRLGQRSELIYKSLYLYQPALISSSEISCCVEVCKLIHIHNFPDLLMTEFCITGTRSCCSQAPAPWGMTSWTPASWSSVQRGQHPESHPPTDPRPPPPGTWRPSWRPTPALSRGAERPSFVSKHINCFEKGRLNWSSSGDLVKSKSQWMV